MCVLNITPRRCRLDGSAVVAALLAVTASAAAPGAFAQSPFPDRPLRLVIAVPPGGAADYTGRVLGAKLAEYLGQSVLIENRPGAGGIVASEYVIKSNADGHTLQLTSSTSHGVAPVLYKKLPYDPMKDFTHIAMFTTLPAMMAVHVDVQAKTVKEFVALAKSRPSGLLFASAGNGSAPQLMGEQFKIASGVPMTHVPYKGSGPAVQDLMTGQVQVMFDGLPSLLPQIRAGRLRPLAALAEKRFTLFPDVPTMAEAGYPGLEAGLWFGVSGPAGIPRPVVDRLVKEIFRVVGQPDVQEKFSTVGAIPQTLGPKEYVAFILKENRRWAEVIKVSGAVPD
jgi:tripartite-type tricarboxylate transporter receptor subunit TctC